MRSEDLAFSDGATAVFFEVEVLGHPLGQPLGVLNVHISAWASLLGRWSPSIAGVLAWVDQLADSNGPVILAGDMNNSPRSAFVTGLIGRGFVDAHAGSGHGLGLTFPIAGRYHKIPLPPSVRIDQVLVRGGIQPVGTRTGPDAGSDHLPLTVDLDVIGSPE